MVKFSIWLDQSLSTVIGVGLTLELKFVAWPGNVESVRMTNNINIDNDKAPNLTSAFFIISVLLLGSIYYINITGGEWVVPLGTDSIGFTARFK